MVLACCAATTVRAQSVFKHWEGVTGRPLLANPYGQMMQQVHEYEYTYYVEPGKAVDLLLPFEGYTSDGRYTRRSNEPKGYIRWYDYKTDMKSSRLSIYDSSNSYLEEVSDAAGNVRGLFAWKKDPSGETYGPSRIRQGVKYTAPSDAANADWAGEDIACDVSRYIDFDFFVSGGYFSKKQYFQREPTLQIRYIFHIRSAKAIAEKIANAFPIDKRSANADLTIEDNRQILFGAKDANSSMAVRVNMKPSNYYFYPLNTTDHHVYAADEAHLIKRADFDKTKLVQATRYHWRAYDKTKTKYTILARDAAENYQIWSLTSMNTIMTNSNGWLTLDGKGTTKPTITFGDVVYIVCYAKNGSNMAPIANFEILYNNTYPKTREQIFADGDNDRTYGYLNSHYQQATKPISFDDDNNTLTLDAPTAENNISTLSSQWDKRAYCYTYPQLRDQSWPDDYGVIHGEYGLYKSANLPGVSDGSQVTEGGNKKYSWNAPGAPVMYDRTHELTGGKQYGHFLYVDASDESRQIATIDFKADLCSGARLIFAGAVADFTSGSTQPQLLFKLYGIIKDEQGKVTYQRLLTSFSSGDFANNIEGGRQQGKWFQVYSRLVIRKKAGVENYSDFRIVVDNMCDDTNGADYAIDDLRLYIQHAKIDVIQNKAVCPSQLVGSGNADDVKLMIASHYDNVQAVVGLGVASKLFYRICDLSGNPIGGIDYNGDGKADEYGVAEVPAAYDASKMLPSYAAGGSTTTPMFIKDADGHTLLLLANRHFDLAFGTKYYISVTIPNEDNPDKPGEWGTPTDACSSYSEDFEFVQQKLIVSDETGNTVSTVRVSCDGSNKPNVSISGKLVTTDVVNGGTITLRKVKFDWFFSERDRENNFASIPLLQETLADYRGRAEYTEVKGLDAGYKSINSSGYALLKKYVDNGQLLLSASNNLDDYQYNSELTGIYKVAAIPVTTSFTEGTVKYDICPDPMYFTLRIIKDGPRLMMGDPNVAYPTDDRSVRIGLPQIRAMMAAGKELRLPVAKLEDAAKVKFQNGSNVFVADSNDPTFNFGSTTKQIVGKLKETTLTGSDTYVSLLFDNDNALDILHEGYWYELNFSFEQDVEGSTMSCPGEVFITFKVVPEYLTWNSTIANRLNANWNNDLNWKRSTAAELYKADYTDYGTGIYDKLNGQQAYTPMKFSKVTIDDQTGKVYPGLGNIVYRVGNNIALKLTNYKGEEATAAIAYDMMVTWNYNTEDHSDTGEGWFTCETFKGNLCDEIYFKPRAELLNQAYLVYNKAYVEKEMSQNKWNIISSPLKDTYAGDFFVPFNDNPAYGPYGRENKEAFTRMEFALTNNSRVGAPVYQRNWDSNGEQVIEGLTGYNAHDYVNGSFRIDTISDGSMNIESLYWSHVYNKLDEKYADGRAFAMKAGDDYKDVTPTWLFRLPKVDKEYFYTDADNNPFGPDGTLMKVVQVDKTDVYKLNVASVTAAGELGTINQPLTTNTHSKNRYYMVGNPYTATLSMYNFLNGNPEFERKVWTIEDGVLKACLIPEGTYNRKQDLLIEPMQAFFVKLKEGESVSKAVFTLLMTVDRWKAGGSQVVSTAAAVNINVVNDGNLCSTAKVVVSDDADDEFSDDEDIELLNNTDIADVPQVYTVAGNQAAALNRLSNINFLPFGVIANEEGMVMKDGGMVTVDISANRYVDDKLFVFDAKNGTFTPVNGAISIKANEHGRYYITTSAYTLVDTNVEANIKCFSTANGTITVSTPNQKLASVRVYTAEGMLVTSESGINAASWTKSIGSGLFVIKAETTNGKSKTFKVGVR